MILRELVRRVVGDVRRFTTALTAQLWLVRRSNGDIQGNSEVHLRAQLSMVDEVARIVTNTLEIDQVYERFATALKKLVDFDRMTIHVLDDTSIAVIRQYLYGLPLPSREGDGDRTLAGTHAEYVMESGQTFRSDNIDDLPVDVGTPNKRVGNHGPQQRRH